MKVIIPIIMAEEKILLWRKEKEMPMMKASILVDIPSRKISSIFNEMSALSLSSLKRSIPIVMSNTDEMMGL